MLFKRLSPPLGFIMSFLFLVACSSGQGISEADKEAIQVLEAVLAPRPSAEEIRIRADADRAKLHEYFERVGNWVITCDIPKKITTGEVVGGNQCTLKPSNSLTYIYKEHLAEIELPYENTLTVRASEGRIALLGPKDPANRSDSYVCGYGPKNHGVDGTSLNGKSHEEQIRILRKGREYGKDRQEEWPSCRIWIGRTPLQGFGPAYDRFLQVSSSRNLG